MSLKRATALLIILALAVLPTVHVVHATNGMNMIGFGARMSSMGGAGFAMSGDALLMFANPASISTLDGKVISGGLGMLMPAVHFTNNLNDEDSDSKTFPLPSLAYVHSSSDCAWSFGIGFTAQGGMGATYPELRHDLFRNYQDGQPTHALIPQEYHSQIAYMKLSPMVSWEANSKLNLGVGLQISYATLEMAMPYSMDPLLMQGNTGFGMTFGQMFSVPPASGGLGYNEVTAYADMKDGTTATGINAIIGMQYKVNDMLTVGFSYASQSDLTFEGDATMDMTSQFRNAYERMVMGAMANTPGLTQEQAMAGVNAQLGAMGINPALGMMDSYDAEVEFAWPQQLGLGVAIRPNSSWIFAVDAKWINWANTMESFKMKFSGGTNANINTMMGTPDGTLNLEMPLKWEDQMVVSLGTEYKATDKLALRCGFNYASNPVPEETLIPIFPAIVESHITLGAGYMLTQNFGVDLGYELVFSDDLDVTDSIIANEYDGSNSELGENIIHIIFNYKF